MFDRIELIFEIMLKFPTQNLNYEVNQASRLLQRLTIEASCSPNGMDLVSTAG
jgi:hypothetical protein